MAINEKSFQPQDYQTYVERGPDSFINYEQLSDNVTKLFAAEEERRQGIKKDLDDRTQSLYDQLAEVEVNKDGKWSDEILSSANQIRKSLMTYNTLLKKGKISATEYKTQMERIKTQMSEMNIITKELGTSYDLHTQRLAIGENGEILAAPDEIAVFNSSVGYGKLDNKKIFIDPVTMNAFMYEIDKDGNIPDFKKNPEKFIAINNARARINYVNDRSQYIISDVSKGMVDQIGTFVNEKLLKYDGEYRDGTYVLSEQGLRETADPKFGQDIQAGMQDLKDIVYEKLTAQGDKGIANTIASLDDRYIMAMSEDEFKAKGGTDLKYFIKIDPNNPDGMTYVFSSEAAKDEAIGIIKDNVSKNVELMVGKELKKSNVTYEPGQTSIQAGGAAADQQQIGFLDRVQDIAVGDLNQFDSASSAGITDINNEIRAGGGSDDDMIDTIRRQGDNIVITYLNGRPVTISRKDKNGNFKSTEELMRELYLIVIPSGSRSQTSFADLVDMYKKSGRQVRVSTRGMTDAEIKKDLQIEAAKANLVAGGNNNPTPAEIRAEMNNVTITDQQVADAKVNGIPQTYVGEDAERFADRDPYKNVELMVGKELKKSNVTYEPGQTSIQAGGAAADQQQIGFLDRVQDIAVGDLNQFDSASSAGITDINNEIRAGGGSDDDMIDTIRRQGDNIVITYLNGRPVTISRKDKNGNFKSTEELMRELYLIVIPSGSRSQTSFADLVDMYKKSGRQVRVSTRGMTDAEIKKDLQIEAAKANLVAGGNNNPTPAEIRAEMNNVTITDQQVADAKVNGIPQTYVGEDAERFADRDPYKIKPVGTALNLDQQTGKDILALTHKDNTETNQPQTKLETFYVGDKQAKRKRQIDPAIKEVFIAYMPSRIRNDYEIFYDKNTEMLVVKGPHYDSGGNLVDGVMNIPGVTDVTIDNNTSYAQLDEYIQKAAAQAIQTQNQVLQQRGSGGGLPSPY